MLVWSLPKRVAFRFGFIAAILFVYPAPLGYIPKTDSLAETFGKPMQWLVQWVGELVAGERPVVQPTGSGDTLFGYVQLLVIVMLAAIGAAVWSVVDRRRLAYPRLAHATWIGLRYVLAMIMIGYGFAKLVDGQFPAPDAIRLDQRIGEMSPMGMLWTFQGSSQPYTIFAGLAEIVPAVLLLWRRTAVIGAVIAMAVMTNVVMLNFCYDVPVKVFSSELLVIAAVIAMPQLRRLLLAALGYAVPEVPPRARSSVRVERVRVAAKLAAVALIVLSQYQMYDQMSEYKRPRGELEGLWSVSAWSGDGERWCKVGFSPWAVAIRQCNDERGLARGEVIAAGQVIVVGTDLWHYVHHGDKLVIDFRRNGKPVHAELTRDPPPLLVSRGFHWIQEFPFNR